MNLLLFDPSSLTSDRFLHLEGARAEHLLYVLKVKPGDRVRVGELNGYSGWARVEEIFPRRAVTLKVEVLEQPAAKPSGLGLFLAIPRPQSLKKVLQTIACLGVDQLYLVNSERVEKAYFSSPLLLEENIKEQLALGLEQGMSTRLPKVEILQNVAPARFSRGAHSEFLQGLSEKFPLKLLAHPSSNRSLATTWQESECSADAPALLAIGPEGGWRDSEVKGLEERGFQSFTFGDRLLRVETAVVYALAQLAVLRELRGRSVANG